MRDNVLWRKQSAIVMMLAKALAITPEKALDLFYSTDTYRQLSDPKTGLQLMGDGYVVENVLNEIRETSCQHFSPIGSDPMGRTAAGRRADALSTREGRAER